MLTTPFVFVSYRRADSSAAARWLANSIARTFGPQSVFIDTEAIRMSDDWAARIDEALRISTLVLPVIGSRWLSLQDADYRRRIDHPSDWVHKEILHALKERKRVLPVLLSRTPMPSAGALPEPLSDLARHQGFELRDERWEADLAALLAEMENFGFVRSSAQKVRYPSPMVSLSELTAQELEDSLAELPDWKLVTSDVAGGRSALRTELTRVYEFASFADAIRFMSEAVPRIEEVKHHPRWENIWRSVSVHLSTWDIGHKPSRLDLELAGYLDTLRQKFPVAKGGATR
jgi:pterin-4a-carbinolamine dehydratase